MSRLLTSGPQCSSQLAMDICCKAKSLRQEEKWQSCAVFLLIFVAKPLRQEKEELCCVFAHICSETTEAKMEELCCACARVCSEVTPELFRRWPTAAVMATAKARLLCNSGLCCIVGTHRCGSAFQEQFHLLETPLRHETQKGLPRRWGHLPRH
eukprot:1068905-Pelagomonas_calceolata.AAC.1